MQCAVWLLHREKVPYQPQGGCVTVRLPDPDRPGKFGQPQAFDMPHFWITIPQGDGPDLVIDYRLRMWFGESAPHGVHEGTPPGVRYRGRPVTHTPNPHLFEILSGLPSVPGKLTVASIHPSNDP